VNFKRRLKTLSDSEKPPAGSNPAPQNDKPIGLRVREEKIVEIAHIDCDMVDARTRKVLLYLVNTEIKKLKGMPQKWSADQLVEMEGIKAGLELCKKIRSKKTEETEEEQNHGYTYKI